MDQLITLQRESHEISKPKIKIVHVFPAEIIKTDSANFREIVQKLTGMPGQKKRKKKMVKKTMTAELIRNEVREEKKEREMLMSYMEDEDDFLNGLLTDLPLLPLVNTSHMEFIDGRDKCFKL